MSDLTHSDNIKDSPEDEPLSNLLLTQLQEPWYKTLAVSAKDLFRRPKLPPLAVTSRPVPVQDIWGLYGRQRKSFLFSTGLNAALVAVVCLLGVTQKGREAIRTVTALVLPADVAREAKPLARVQGGGGDRSALPASFGKLPKASLRQFAPPEAVYNNTAPLLAMDPSIIAPPDAALPQVNSDHYGDPFSKGNILSNGQGPGSGIGNHGGPGGVGDHNGPGFGEDGFGTGALRSGGEVSQPKVSHKVEPEYSDEARKAKYQGTVVLYIEVDVNGKPTNIQVVRSLGMGLDEKAVEAVKKWTFVPGKRNGVPVKVMATVEVAFHLL
ncbi:MAG TPA: energy transducer TonB [Bryobacteraceae bacterium]|nr:energy transducer TonB [Bryobacteraceae bacterium]